MTTIEYTIFCQVFSASLTFKHNGISTNTRRNAITLKKNPPFLFIKYTLAFFVLLSYHPTILKIQWLRKSTIPKAINTMITKMFRKDYSPRKYMYQYSKLTNNRNDAKPVFYNFSIKSFLYVSYIFTIGHRLRNF